MATKAGKTVALKKFIDGKGRRINIGETISDDYDKQTLAHYERIGMIGPASKGKKSPQETKPTNPGETKPAGPGETKGEGEGGGEGEGDPQDSNPT